MDIHHVKSAERNEGFTKFHRLTKVQNLVSFKVNTKCERENRKYSLSGQLTSGAQSLHASLSVLFGHVQHVKSVIK